LIIDNAVHALNIQTGETELLAANPVAGSRIHGGPGSMTDDGRWYCMDWTDLGGERGFGLFHTERLEFKFVRLGIRGHLTHLQIEPGGGRLFQFVGRNARDEIRLFAADDAEGFPFLTPWHGAISSILKEGRWAGDHAQWTLLRGDAVQRIHEAKAPFDLVFHDPFSAEHNGPLWSLAFFTALKRLCAPDAMLATYSAATPVRVALLLAGFYVGSGLPTGTRGETTVAAITKERLAQPLGKRWLERWQRSSRRAPHGAETPADLEARINAHPQFQNMEPRS
jgi:hypothetical protein